MIGVHTTKVFLSFFLLINVFCISMTGIFLKQNCRTGTVHVNTDVKRTFNSRVELEKAIKLNGSNLTDKLWNFGADDIEKIFLLTKLLTQEHSFNKENAENLRDELLTNTKPNFSNYLIVDQQNSPNGSQLRYNGQRKNVFNITEDIHSKLPKPEEFSYERVKRCSVIGNSGSILNSKCGKEIDSADYVYRCNAAPIADFVEDAGKKSNFTSFNPSIFGKRYKRLAYRENLTHFISDMKQYQGILWLGCFSFKAYTEQCIEALKSYNITENKYTLGHPDHFLNMMRFWKSRGVKKRMTTGFYLVSVALMRCDEVHLYGFWPFSQRIDATIENTKYHYFDNTKYNFSKGPHGMNAEFSVYVQLHLLGVLQLHVGKCTL